LSLLACPAANVCVGIDEEGRLWSSREAAGGVRRWNRRPIVRGGGYLGATSLACPSVHFCLATAYGRSGGDCCDLTALATSHPLRGTWAQATVVRGYYAFAFRAVNLIALACPSSGLCLAVTGAGDSVYSFAPLRRGSWRLGATPDSFGAGGSSGFVPLSAVACASASLCLAGDVYGSLLVARRTS
jgi:hypothetical protein